jgi:OmpA-OmpF porin, OOP family
MDRKRLICFVLLITVTGVSHADDFFVNTSLGETNFYFPTPPGPNVFYGHSHTEALRFGYRWTAGAFSYGLEAGYANLGRSYSYDAYILGFDRVTERIDGFTLGPTLKYALPMGFYVSAHGGLFRSTDHQVDKFTGSGLIVPTYSVTSRSSFSGMGSFAGVGLGYDFNHSFGVSLNYDRYRAHLPNVEDEVKYQLFAVPPRVDAYSVTAEYRF